MRLAYVLYGELLAPVVASQAFPLLAGLRERGHDVCLVAVASPRRFLERDRYARALTLAEEAAGEVRVITHAPRHMVPGWVAMRLSSVLRRLTPDVTHCRQSRAAALAARAGANGIVADFRGVRPEEYLLALGKEEKSLDRGEARRLAALRAEDRTALDRCSAAVCVSEPYRQHLGGDDRVFVIPNASELIPEPSPDDRRKLRGTFGLRDEDVAFVYSGSVAPWQCVGAAVRLFSEVRRGLARARLVLLTHDAGAAEVLAREHGVEDAVIRTLSPGETRSVLPAFDVSLLLREPNVVNRVAAPVKFGEYMQAGVPVAMTRGVGDASGWVAEHGLGVVLESPVHEANAGAVLDALASFNSVRCRAFARERLSFDVTIPRYEEAYEAARARGPR